MFFKNAKLNWIRRTIGQELLNWYYRVWNCTVVWAKRIHPLIPWHTFTRFSTYCIQHTVLGNSLSFSSPFMAEFDLIDQRVIQGNSLHLWSVWYILTAWRLILLLAEYNYCQVLSAMFIWQWIWQCYKYKLILCCWCLSQYVTRVGRYNDIILILWWMMMRYTFLRYC